MIDHKSILSNYLVSRLINFHTDIELIWYNPRIASMFSYYNCNYDDLSAFGIEESFSTVQPCKVDGTNPPFSEEI